ncbi:MAG: hypothetical protein QGD94_11490, partial [Planctomycetia bacterium]|nr:hypothetical protein [Planctomycetia bacterium]
MSEGEGGQELAEGDLTLRKLMRFAVEQGASDLHLKIGRPPALRLGGEIRFLNLPPFDDEQVHTLAMACMTPRQQEQYLAEGTLDFAYMIEGGDRFRLNVFRQRGFTSVAARRGPSMCRRSTQR